MKYDLFFQSIIKIKLVSERIKKQISLMKKQNSSNSQWSKMEFRDYNWRKDARIEHILQLFIKNYPNHPSNQMRDGDRVVDIIQSNPTPTIVHPTTVSAEVYVHRSEGHAIPNNGQDLSPSERWSCIFQQPMENLRDWLNHQDPSNFDERSLFLSSQNSLIFSSLQSSSFIDSMINQSFPTRDQMSSQSYPNSITPQQESQLRTFNPYIVQPNMDDQYRCNCHELMCSTKQCGCWIRNKKCNLECKCNSRKCMNHEHQIDSDDSDEMEKRSKQDRGDEQDKKTPFEFNTTFVPADLSSYIQEL